VSEEFEDTKARVNQNPYIEGQTTQWSKEKRTKGQNYDLQNNEKHTHKVNSSGMIKKLIRKRIKINV
jgi:hypothetical protein